MAMHDHADARLRGISPTLRVGLVLLAFMAIVGALLFTEQRAHVLGVLLWLPLIACPLLHMFMHGSHGHGGHMRHRDHDGDRSAS